MQDTLPQASLEGCLEKKEEILSYGSQLGQNIDANRDTYNKWAKQYDDLHDRLGLNDPNMILEQVKNFPKDSKIIDFGCGTGRMGELLHEAGFTHIVGVDGSTEMLETCRAKNVYKSLHECLVGCEEL